MTKMFQIYPRRISQIRLRKSHAILLIWSIFLLGNGQGAIAQASAVQWLESPHAGADQDRDGVRDDVAENLRQSYEKPGQQHWAMEVARAGQRFVTSDGNPFAIYRAQAEMQRAMRCLGQLAGENAAGGIRDNVLGLLLDTDGRRQAYNQAVALWEEDVRHRELPSRPDDRWDATCGAHGRATVPAGPNGQNRTRKAVAPAPLPAAELMPAVVRAGELEPPNFFLTGNIPAAAPVRVADKSSGNPAGLPDWAAVPVPRQVTVDEPEVDMTLPESVVVVDEQPAAPARQEEVKPEPAPLPPGLQALAPFIKHVDYGSSWNPPQ